MTEQEKILREKAKEQLQTFLDECKIKDLSGKRILELGFGNGLFLDECYKAGLASVGLEVHKESAKTVNAKLPHLEAILYDGIKFPLPDQSIDFIVSFQVLEHVRSLEDIMSECVRVLRPGGIMYHVCPNYFSFYEGHFAVFWLPFLNKKLGLHYLKLIGSQTSGYQDLNLIKPGGVVRALKAHREKIKIISLGRTEFVNRFNIQQIDKVNQKFLRAALKVMFAMPESLRKGLLHLIAMTNLYYPITIIAQRL